MRVIVLFLIILMMGCGREIPQMVVPPSPPVTQKPTPTPAPLPSPTTTPIPTPTPRVTGDRICLVNVPDSAIPKIFKAYADWKYLREPVIVKDNCEVIITGQTDKESYAANGSQYNGLWWYYDNIHHIFINTERGDNWLATFPHELGHRFWLPHKFVPDGEYNEPYAHKTGEGYMDCRSIMSTCSWHGITDKDREELRKYIIERGEQGVSKDFFMVPQIEVYRCALDV